MESRQCYVFVFIFIFIFFNFWDFLWVTLDDFAVKMQDGSVHNQNWLNIKEMWCVAVNHIYMCYICAKAFLD